MLAMKDVLMRTSETLKMSRCERDVLFQELHAQKEKNKTIKEEYEALIENMKIKESAFQTETNAQITTLKQQLISGLQASVLKVNALKAELEKERALVARLQGNGS